MIHLNTLLNLVNTNHTEIQLDRFITIKSGLTPYGCLFQSLRELHSRKQALQAMGINLVRLHQKHQTTTDSLDALEIDLAIAESQRNLKSTEREFLRFYSQASSIYTYLGFDKNPPTVERLEQLDVERWEHRILADAAISILGAGVISGPIIATIQCLPDSMRKRICDRCFGDEQGRQQRLSELVSWFMEYKFDLPEPLALSEIEAKKVLACCELPDSFKLLENSSQTDVISLLKSNTENDYQSVNNVKSGSVSGVRSVAAS